MQIGEIKSFMGSSIFRRNINRANTGGLILHIFVAAGAFRVLNGRKCLWVEKGVHGVSDGSRFSNDKINSFFR
jgi:hypothetical protein